MSDIKSKGEIQSLLKNKFKIVSLAAPDKTIEEVRDWFLNLRNFKDVKHKGKVANEFNKDTIKDLRNKIKQSTTNLCALKHVSKQFVTYVTLQDYNSLTLKLKDRKALFVAAYQEYVSNVKSFRQKERALVSEDKTELGFKYKMSGNVFTTKGSVLALQSVESQMHRIKVAKVPSKGNKRNYIGIELELVCCLTKEQLEQRFCENYLGGYVYIKRDGSIQVENNGDFAHEVTLMCPENMYESVVERVCKVLNERAVGCYVNNSCGLHVHYDARNREINKMFSNMVSVLPLAQLMVPKNRINSSHAQQYCKLNKHKLFEEQRKLGDRYTAVNAESFRSHNTVEVRLHSGTTNPIKIRAWVKLFLNSINHPEVITEDVVTVSKYASLFGVDTKLNDYMMKRMKLFAEKGDAIDTRADHHLFNDVVAV